MKKKSTGILLSAVVFLLMGVSSTVYGEAAEDDSLEAFLKKIKNPTPEINWGYDLRLREIYAKNFLWLDNDSAPEKGEPENEWQWQRFRSRLWFNITPTEDIEIKSRLVWEPRNYCYPETDARRGPFEWDEAIFDKLNIKVKDFFDLPLDIKVGRQDLIFGNGWLILDGTPMDGSRTICFDAARFTYHMSETTDLDMIYIDQRGQWDETIKPFNDQNRRGGLNSWAEQDERGAIFYLTNKSLVPDAKVEGYYIWKHDREIERDRGSNDGHYHTLGARIDGSMNENWGYRAGFAEQVGQKNYEDLCAFAFNGRLTYKLNDAWKNAFHGGYEYVSGDDPGTETDEGFDMLWARWPRWSELYIYTYATESRIAENNNLHRINFGWNADPSKKIHLSSDYHLLFADENTRGGAGGFSENGKFRGQLLTTKLIYKFSPRISGHLWGEYFFPGGYYTDDRNDAAAFLRYELVITF